MDKSEQLLAFVRENGPIIPSQATSILGMSILFTSAMLSELSSRGLVKVSHLKVGGTPLYYVDGQEEKLERYSDRLGEKHRAALEALRAGGVLRDRELEAVSRVALSDLKDFARPIEVSVNGGRELFWKWHLLSERQTEDAVGRILGSAEGGTEGDTDSDAQAGAATTSVQALPKEKRRERRHDDFLEKVSAYFSQNNITVVEQKVIRKNREIDAVVRIPHALGSSLAYCKCSNKRRLTDADIGAAYAQGQIRRLPAILLSEGTPTKKAQTMLATDLNINLARL